jgi:hypothetical protein
LPEFIRQGSMGNSIHPSPLWLDSLEGIGVLHLTRAPFAPGFALVVPHKLVGRNFFGAWTKCVPSIGQVVAALQSNP